MLSSSISEGQIFKTSWGIPLETLILACFTWMCALHTVSVVGIVSKTEDHVAIWYQNWSGYGTVIGVYTYVAAVIVTYIIYKLLW